MSTEELQKRTTVNIQEKANLIWAIADKLVGTYKPQETELMAKIMGR